MKSSLFAAVTAFGLAIASPVFAMPIEQVPQPIAGGVWGNYQQAPKGDYQRGYTNTAKARYTLARAEAVFANQDKRASA